jgi:hypothetical protein
MKIFDRGLSFYLELKGEAWLGPKRTKTLENVNISTCVSSLHYFTGEVFQLR